MPPATGYDHIGTVQDAIVSLLTTNEPTFIARRGKIDMHKRYEIRLQRRSARTCARAHAIVMACSTPS
jgi:hypothetical protein